MFTSASPRRVESDVLALCRAYHDVLWAIVGLVPVYVVHDLGISQSASNLLFGHKAMFVDAAVLICAGVALRRDHGGVSIFCQRPTAIPSVVLRSALVVTKNVKRAIHSSSRNDSATSASTSCGDRVIARPRACEKFLSVPQVISALLLLCFCHNPIVTHGVYHYGVCS